MTIIFFAACRNKSPVIYEQYISDNVASEYNGISIVFYSSELGKTTQMI
jgi:hypothetical protein